MIFAFFLSKDSHRRKENKQTQRMTCGTVHVSTEVAAFLAQCSSSSPPILLVGTDLRPCEESASAGNVVAQVLWAVRAVDSDWGVVSEQARALSQLLPCGQSLLGLFVPWRNGDDGSLPLCWDIFDDGEWDSPPWLGITRQKEEATSALTASIFVINTGTTTGGEKKKKKKNSGVTVVVCAMHVKRILAQAPPTSTTLVALLRFASKSDETAKTSDDRKKYLDMHCDNDDIFTLVEAMKMMW